MANQSSRAQRPRHQHRLPATILAQFAPQILSPARLSKVFVKRRSASRVSQQSAEKLTVENNVYDIDDFLFAQSFKGGSLENVWHVYENNLARLLAFLKNSFETHSDVTVDQYIVQTMIPYMAGVAVRGSDFDERVRNMQPNINADGLNGRRILAWQRAQTAIFHSRILYFRPFPGRKFITNDAGYFVSQIWDGPEGLCAIFPVTPELAFGFTRSGEPSFRPSTDSKGQFFVEEVSFKAHFPAEIEVSRFAYREIYGAGKAQLEDIELMSQRPMDLLTPQNVMMLGGALPEIEMIYWRRAVLAMGLGGLIKIDETNIE